MLLYDLHLFQFYTFYCLFSILYISTYSAIYALILMLQGSFLCYFTQKIEFLSCHCADNEYNKIQYLRIPLSSPMRDKHMGFGSDTFPGAVLVVRPYAPAQQ